MIPLVYLIFPAFIATAETAKYVDQNVQEEKLIEASKAAAAAGQPDLAKQLLCRSKQARTEKECKQ